MRSILLLLTLLSFLQLQEIDDSDEYDDNGMTLIDEYLATTSPRFNEFKPGGLFGQKMIRMKNKMKNFNNSTSVDEPNSGFTIFMDGLFGSSCFFVLLSIYIGCKKYRDRDRSGTVTPTSGYERVNVTVRTRGTHRGVEATKYRQNKKAMEEFPLSQRFPKNYDAIQEVTEPSTSRQSTAPSGSFATGDLSRHIESGASTSNSTPARQSRRVETVESEEQEETPILYPRRPSTRSHLSSTPSGSYNVADIPHIDSAPSTSNNTPVRQARETLQVDEEEDPEGPRRSKRISMMQGSSRR